MQEKDEAEIAMKNELMARDREKLQAKLKQRQVNTDLT